ncbi:MAG: NADH-quinone oxidoreductase subunit C, partial [Armatimonadota bacterium]|nr:NADH-quinone oxidoreductase subunit C [Armatimonadota bacterium]
MVREQEFLMELWTHFPDVLQDLQEHVRNQYVATIPREVLPAVVKHAVNQLGARFVITVATDMRPKTGDYRISYILAFDKQKKFLVLQSTVPPDDMKVTSVTPDIPAAGWAEREAFDLMGIVPVG